MPPHLSAEAFLIFKILASEHGEKPFKIKRLIIFQIILAKFGILRYNGGVDLEMQ